MLLFRSLAVGLLGACFILLVKRPSPPRIAHERELVAVAAPTRVVAPTIIDVAHGTPASQIAQLVRLDPDERVTAVDDQPVTGNLDAGTVIAPATGRQFIDLTISRPAVGKERRVLVLVH